MRKFIMNTTQEKKEMYLELTVLSSLFILSISGEGDNTVGIFTKTCLVLMCAAMFQLLQFMRAGHSYIRFIYSPARASSA